MVGVRSEIVTVLHKALPYIISGAILLVSIYFYNLESPQERVLRILEELAYQLSIQPPEEPLKKLELVNGVVGKFNQEFHLDIKVDQRQLPSITHKEALRGNLLAVKKMVRQMRVQFVNLRVKSEGDLVIVTGEVQVDSIGYSQQRSPIEFRFFRQGKNWLIVFVEVTNSLNSFGRWRH